jgi:MFS family permease
MQNTTAKYKSEKELTFFAQTICMGAIFFGYSMSVLSLASTTIFTVLEVEKNDIPYFNSILTASIPFGAMFGSVLTGKLLDFISRKKSLMLLDSLGILAALLS